jgi:hypothetical protein
MPFGPAIPYGEFDTMPNPSSFSVGTSGQRLVRFSPQVTRSRIFPALTCGPQPVASAAESMWPPRSAAMLGALPLCGTCTHLRPCLNAISSIVMWRLVFAPGVP